MATVTYDDRSFMLDGQRIWLVSGSMDYFRIPSGLWKDRLLKAKQAGLNCIATNLAWNVHEPLEGRWDFSGQNDVRTFLQLAQELGLWVILKPGPYIGENWDFGGLPGWLAGKSGITCRTNNAAFSHYTQKYFDSVVAPLADLQVTHGGPIVLVQCENHFIQTVQPDRLNYLEFLTQLFRRSGFSVPIITNNELTQPMPDDTVETAGGSDYLTAAKQLRRLPQDIPLLFSELPCGQNHAWAAPLSENDTVTVSLDTQQQTPLSAKAIARHAIEALGHAGQINYACYHGGTNFAFWGGQYPHGQDVFQPTSYDNNAPISETGHLRDSYYTTRLVNLLASSMASYFADVHLEEPAVTIENATEIFNLQGPQGHWAIVTNHGRDEISSVDLALPCGKRIAVSLETLGAVALPVDMRLPNQMILDYCSLQPLGLFGTVDRPLLVLYGAAKLEGCISFNGQEIALEVPNGEPRILEHLGVTIVILPDNLAEKTWFVNGQMWIGPDYVELNEAGPIAHCGKKIKIYWTFSLEQRTLVEHAADKPVKPPKPPKLRPLAVRAICSEPTDETLQWKALDRPRSLEKLGANYGYGWYRLQWNQSRSKVRNLLLPDCADRAHLHMNGQPVGCWGIGQDATQQPIKVQTRKGKNTLIALTDNLGRVTAGPRLGQPKGLFGHIYDAKRIRTNKFKIRPAESFSKRIIPRIEAHLIPQLESMPLYSADLGMTVTNVTPIQMSFTNLPHHAAVFCNDRPVGFFANTPTNRNWGQVTLGAELQKGKNVIRLLLWGEVNPADLAAIEFYSLVEPISAEAEWGFRPWTIPAEQSVATAEKKKTCWFSTSFETFSPEVPMCMEIGGPFKGQLLFNGFNAGRIWTLGPVQRCYLPCCWGQNELNTILLFSESGEPPAKCRLIYDAI